MLTAEEIKMGSGCGANLRWANLSGSDLLWANLSRAELRGANLSRAELRWANLSGSDLRWANLSWADLSGANLSEADLRWANLSGSDLREANLIEAKGFHLLPVADPRGYSFVHAVQCDDEWKIRSGCRDLSIDDARKHWGDGYSGERWIGDMYLYAIDWLEKRLSEAQ